MALRITTKFRLSFSILAGLAALTGCSGSPSEQSGSSSNAITGNDPAAAPAEHVSLFCQYKVSSTLVQIADDGGPSCRKTVINTYTGVGQSSDSACECPASAAAVPDGATTDCIVSVDTDAHTSVVEHHYVDGTCVDSKIDTLTGKHITIVFKAPCSCE